MMFFLIYIESRLHFSVNLILFFFFFLSQETFDAGLQAFEKEGIHTITALKEQLILSNHAQTPAIEKRYNDVIAR